MRTAVALFVHRNFRSAFGVFQCATTSESDKALTDARNNLKLSDFDGASNNLDKAIKSAKESLSASKRLYFALHW